jgi:hypothetical protein
MNKKNKQYEFVKERKEKYFHSTLQCFQPIVKRK